ncbi:hypothetical protein [Steroidobacter sp.]|uniref:hypothetical protein n=1 Tax=Steroidobacter sp. TaxID=1978227 RepID=UPI001A5726AD|nr:hypothetical protein [Steroidobacter sp.]MBL8271126.1 hypothetical protein [Steroidobacter sp.]
MKMPVMKMRLVNGLLAIALGTALSIGLSGCVSYGNTHALVTPVGAIGYHSFKPEHRTQPREIKLPEPSAPDQIAAVNQQPEPVSNGEQ